MAKAKIQRVKGDIERRMLIGAITSDRFLRRVQHVYQANILSHRSRYVATVMGWCLNYWKRYEAAPGKEIENIFHAEVKQGKLNEEHADLIADVLETASEEYEQEGTLNVDYLLDKVRDHMAELGAEALADEIKDGLALGNVRDVEVLISKYRRVELSRGQDINPFTDPDEIYGAFEETNKPIIQFGGALGDMMNDALTTDSLVGIMGPEKRGKTWMLMEFIFAAIRSRKNVAFFAVGDMSKDQMIRRLHIRLAGRSNIERYCQPTVIPILDCIHNQDDSCQHKYRIGHMGLGFDPEEEGFDASRTPRGYRSCAVCQRTRSDRKQYKGSYWFTKGHKLKKLTWRDGLVLGRRFFGRMKGRAFKLSCHPNSSINVAQISNQLDVWDAAENFVPNVVIIDYADILAPEPFAPSEYRHQQNETWKALRRLSQEHHCLVVTATQADARSYEQESLTERNFSEDKRKYGHVIGMFGLNQTREEKEQGLMRLNCLMLREGEFSVLREVKVLQCLSRGKVHIGSFW